MHKGSSVLAAGIVLFFLFTPMTPQCRIGTNNECMASTFVPGFDSAKYGVDITTLFFNRNNRKRVMNPLVWEREDGGCTLCDNPLVNISQLQKLPLAIINWKANISCQQKVQHFASKSVVSVIAAITKVIVNNDWKKELNMNVKFSATQWILAGSDSNYTSIIKHKNARDKYVFLFHHVSCSYYRFVINKTKFATETFNNDVKILPEKYDHNSKRKYHDLINSYGTHFITEFDLGVGVRILTALPVRRIQLEGLKVSEISQCLEIKVGKFIGFGEVSQHTNYEKCKDLLTRRWLENEQLMSFVGGQSKFTTNPHHSAFEDNNSIVWLENAKKMPQLLSYSLQPLHTLLDAKDPRRHSLQQAVSEYVGEKALWENCAHSCPPQQRSQDKMTDEGGLGRLSVTIERAWRLWGDRTTRSDAYVSVRFLSKSMCTKTIWNNNNPEWYTTIDFGIVQIPNHSIYIEIQVWDEDNGWDDDLLGKCFQSVSSLDSVTHLCTLPTGTLQYVFHFECFSHLGGPFCWQLKINSSEHYYQRG